MEKRKPRFISFDSKFRGGEGGREEKEKKKWRGEDVGGGRRKEKESSINYSCGSVVEDEDDDSGTISEYTSCSRCNNYLVPFVLMRIEKCRYRWHRVSMALG